MEQLQWLAVVRHGQSTGNVTAEEAEVGGSPPAALSNGCPTRPAAASGSASGEAELMAVAHATTIANCSISSWHRIDGELCPQLFNSVDHLHREGAPPTRQEDVNAEPV
jgi:hypothetical protein